MCSTGYTDSYTRAIESLESLEWNSDICANWSTRKWEHHTDTDINT
jgi:hypothetical protein